MHREHDAYSNPTCGLCAPFVWHTFDSSFYLCRARMERTHTPSGHNGDNPSVFTKRTTRHNAYVCNDNNIPGKRVVRLLCCMAIAGYCFFPIVFSNV